GFLSCIASGRRYLDNPVRTSEAENVRGRRDCMRSMRLEDAIWITPYIRAKRRMCGVSENVRGVGKCAGYLRMCETNASGRRYIFSLFLFVWRFFSV
ncbi:MAG: hypothetical protein IJL84_00270, partial [Paludibacteraceae bacterium]|nr:hypothetical protein [Paludibacteraceae bacterium]